MSTVTNLELNEESDSHSPGAVDALVDGLARLEPTALRVDPHVKAETVAIGLLGALRLHGYRVLSVTPSREMGS